MSRKLWPRTFVAACMWMALAGCGSSGHSSGSPDHTANLKALVLRPSDLPRALAFDSARYWTNRQAAARDHVPVSSYDAHGRIRSYQIGYSVSFTTDQPAFGLDHARSEITAYKDGGGAHWDWLRLRRVWSRAKAIGSTTLGTTAGQAAIPVPFRPITIPRVGDEDAAFAVTWGGDEFAYTTTVIVFRQGSYVATLQTIAIMGQFSLHRIVTIARAIDQRIKASA